MHTYSINGSLVLSCVHFPSEESCTKEIIILGGASNTRAATLTMKLPLFDTYIIIYIYLEPTLPLF